MWYLQRQHSQVYLIVCIFGCYNFTRNNNIIKTTIQHYCKYCVLPKRDFTFTTKLYTFPIFLDWTRNWRLLISSISRISKTSTGIGSPKTGLAAGISWFPSDPIPSSTLWIMWPVPKWTRSPCPNWGPDVSSFRWSPMTLWNAGSRMCSIRPRIHLTMHPEMRKRSMFLILCWEENE